MGQEHVKLEITLGCKIPTGTLNSQWQVFHYGVPSVQRTFDYIARLELQSLNVSPEWKEENSEVFSKTIVFTETQTRRINDSTFVKEELERCSTVRAQVTHITFSKQAEALAMMYWIEVATGNSISIDRACERVCYEESFTHCEGDERALSGRCIHCSLHIWPDYPADWEMKRDMMRGLKNSFHRFLRRHRPKRLRS